MSTRQFINPQEMTVSAGGEEKTTNQDLPPTPDNWRVPYNIECPCCLEVPKQGRVILNCRHLLCVNCFIQHAMRSKECPICRKEMYLIPRPHTRRNRTRVLELNTAMNNEINRRLQTHINEITHIRENLPINANIIRTRNLREAPPLQTSRNLQGEGDRDIEPIYDSNTNYIEPMTTRQYIIITTFTVADILIMLLWLHMINNKHKNT